MSIEQETKGYSLYISYPFSDFNNKGRLRSWRRRRRSASGSLLACRSAMKENGESLCYMPVSTRYASKVGWVVRRTFKELLKRPRDCKPRCVVCVW